MPSAPMETAGESEIGLGVEGGMGPSDEGSAPMMDIVYQPHRYDESDYHSAAAMLKGRPAAPPPPPPEPSIVTSLPVAALASNAYGPSYYGGAPIAVAEVYIEERKD